MSRSFLGFGQVPYIGQPFVTPIKLTGISGRVIPLLFNWIAYGASTTTPNINVLVNITNPSCKALDQIRSIYIDNLGSSNPVYVYFPDTGSTLAAKANSEGWYPVQTNSREFWVIGEGFFTGNIPQTFILLSNVPFQASVNTELDQAVALWKASPVITRGSSIYNSAFGVPALGDQSAAYFTTNNAPGVFQSNLWGTPFSSGFIYLTHISVKCIQVAVNGGGGQWVLESTGSAGTLYTFQVSVQAGSNAGTPLVSPTFQDLLTFSGMNLKLDATQTWRLRMSTISAAMILAHTFNFTNNPQ